jgi:DNA primase
VDIADLLECVDIVEYIQQYCTLTQTGEEYWGLSPFTNEKTASFSVNPDRQIYYDFSSGQGGNVIDFIEKYNKVNTYNAINILKRYVNLSEDSVPKRLASTKVIKRFKSTKREKYISHEILSDDVMQRYENQMSKYQTWIDEGISLDSMRKFQVRYDRISDRIVFPIRDIAGRIFSISGRTLDPDYKAKNQRKYTYFYPLGALDTIYGLYENADYIRKRKEIILFEGAKSVMKADTWSVCNTGAVLSGHLNPEQFKILIKLGVRVVFALDYELDKSNKPVDIRSDENIKKLLKFVKVEVVKNRNNLLQPKMAPVDAGIEVWNELYEGRISLN